MIQSSKTKLEPIVWRPVDVETLLNVSAVTRWRMERDGRLPARDFFLDDKPIGWYPQTLTAAFAPRAACAEA